MTEDELQSFSNMMNVLGEIYSKEISEKLFEIYWSILKGYSFDAIRKAVYLYLNDAKAGKYMPKPADILDYLQEDQRQAALEAWAKVESAIRHVGRYGQAAFSDPLIPLVINKMGGWGQMCSYEISQLPLIINQFIEHYRCFTQKQQGCLLEAKKGSS